MIDYTNRELQERKSVGTQFLLLLLLSLMVSFYFSRNPFNSFDMCCDASRDKFIQSFFLELVGVMIVFVSQRINAISKCIRVQTGWSLTLRCKCHRFYYKNILRSLFAPGFSSHSLALLSENYRQYSKVKFVFFTFLLKNRYISCW